jgi:two-component system OmpR family response regulator
MKILIVEDEEFISKPLKQGLEGNNYAVDVIADGLDALSAMRVNSYDCIILDLNLPGMDGVDVCKTARSEGIEAPILMLTARSQMDDKLEGLTIGADDYITKPFNFRELLLRVANLIKRSKPESSEVLSVGNVVLDPKKVTVEVDGKEVELNKKEFGILQYLMRHQGEVVSQSDLIEHVWSTDEADMFSHSLRTHILNLRKKVDSKRKIIKTIKGHGYKIEETN